MQFPSGLLRSDGSPTPMLLDAIRHSETGHLNDAQAVGAVSKKDAIGPYQLLRKNLHQMGYKMPTNISEADATDIDKSRELAAKYVTGYNQHHKFNNPLHSLAAFNMGPTATARWIKDGADFNKLPQETKEYVTRASVFLNQGQNDMMPNQNAALSTNKTSMLHPDLQADVAKMRNNQVPEDVISDYISQRSQYYNSLPAAPAAAQPALAAPAQPNAAAQPALAAPAQSVTQGMLAQQDVQDRLMDMARNQQDTFTSGSLGVQAPQAALSTPDDSFMSPDDDMLAGGEYPIWGNENPDATWAKVGNDIRKVLVGKNRHERAEEAANRKAMSAEIDNAPDPIELPNTTLPDDESIVPAPTDQGVLAMDAARNQQDTFTTGSLGVQAPLDTKSDNSSERPDESLLKQANEQLGQLNASSGRRNNAMLTTNPTRNIGGDANDRIRIGGAMVEASQRGGLAAMGAGAAEFGAIEDRDLAASAALAKAQAKVKPKKQLAPIIENPTVTTNIDKLIPQLDEDIASWWPSNKAGFVGSLLSNINGTEARDFEARLTTIKANIGFDKLQAMRDASPTGGALGQVSEMELKQLNASMGNLDNSQSPEQLRENLIAVREQYVRTLAAINAQRQGYIQMQGGGGLTQSQAYQPDANIMGLIQTYTQ